MPAKRKPEGALARPRERQGKQAAPPAIHGERMPARIPAADPNWHPIAKKVYNSYRSSGQSALWQNSDWTFAYSLCDDLSRFKNEEVRRDRDLAALDRWRSLSKEERKAEGLPSESPTVSKGGSAMKMNAIMDALGRLGATEADRLKARIELTEPQPDVEDAEVVAIEDARKRLMG